jgi:hypothetical protein
MAKTPHVEVSDANAKFGNKTLNRLLKQPTGDDESCKKNAKPDWCQRQRYATLQFS